LTATMERPTRVVVPRQLPVPVRRKRFLLAVANHSMAIALAVVFLVPLVFVGLTAVMSLHQSLSSSIWPHPFVWSNFSKVFHSIPFLRYTWNTVLYAVLSTVGVVVSSIPVAYALARMRWKGSQATFVVVLATMMLPAQVTSIPLYVLFAKLHWIGSLKPLIVPSFFGDPFSIFLLRQFFLTIPQELIDAARVDGAGEWQILTRIVVRLAKPAIVAVGLFQFFFAWNDFFNPLIYTGNSSNIWTLAVGLSQFTNLQRGVLFNLQMAASVLFILPVIIVFFFAQKAFVEGVTLTGVKG
jgi:multiple sugar transport system permease protein